MAFVQESESKIINFQNELNPKGKVDRVGRKKKKAEMGVSAYWNKNNARLGRSLHSGFLDNSTISKSPNLHKSKGVAMKNGFIQIPRSLFCDKNWIKLNLKQRHLFLIVVENCNWKKTIENFEGNKIVVNPGEWLVSMRDLANLCNQNMKFRGEPEFTKSSVNRYLNGTGMVRFLGHEVGHGISKIKILYPGFYEPTNNFSGTGNGTESGTGSGTLYEEEEEEKQEIHSSSLVERRKNLKGKNKNTKGKKKYGSKKNVLLSENEFARLKESEKYKNFEIENVIEKYSLSKKPHWKMDDYEFLIGDGWVHFPEGEELFSFNQKKAEELRDKFQFKMDIHKIEIFPHKAVLTQERGVASKYVELFFEDESFCEKFEKTAQSFLEDEKKCLTGIRK